MPFNGTFVSLSQVKLKTMQTDMFVPVIDYLVVGTADTVFCFPLESWHFNKTKSALLGIVMFKLAGCIKSSTRKG